jgi:hypothetical protein
MAFACEGFALRGGTLLNQRRGGGGGVAETAAGDGRDSLARDSLAAAPWR